MWKPAKGILLPTKEDTILFIGNKHLHYNFSIEKRECISQHLYIINDDVIKESDWCIHNAALKAFEKGLNSNLNSVLIQCKTDQEVEIFSENCLKVIATTDTSLWEHDDTVPYPKTKPACPHPSQQFIQLFVEAVNKTDLVADGGLISLDVLVEYEIKEEKVYDNLGGHPGGHWEDVLILKLNPDNSINIKFPSKDSFTRQEYEAGLREAFRAGNRRGYDQRSKMAGAEGLNEPDEDTWIKVNLEQWKTSK